MASRPPKRAAAAAALVAARLDKGEGLLPDESEDEEVRPRAEGGGADSDSDSGSGGGGGDSGDDDSDENRDTYDPRKEERARRRAKEKKKKGLDAQLFGDSDEDEDESDEDEDEDEDEDGGGGGRGKAGKAGKAGSKRPAAGKASKGKGGAKRAKRTGASLFIEDVADVAGEDEEEESDGDGEDFIERELGGVGQGEAAEARRLAREIEASRSAAERRGAGGGRGGVALEGKTEAEIEEYFRQRYREDARAGGRADDFDELDEHEQKDRLRYIRQQAMQPTVHDPKLWLVRCKPGQEREAVASILQKAYVKEAEGEPLQITGALFMDHLRGFIYIEAFREPHAREAIKGIKDILGYKLTRVPLEEMTKVLQAPPVVDNLKPGAWARVRSGPYKGDIALVEDVDDLSGRATVKLIPRIDLEFYRDKFRYERERDDSLKPVRRKGSRPGQRFMTEGLADEITNVLQGYIERRGGTRKGRSVWRFENMEFLDGYILKEISARGLETQAVNPSIDEVQRFHGGKVDYDKRDEDDDDVDDDLPEDEEGAPAGARARAARQRAKQEELSSLLQSAQMGQSINGMRKAAALKVGDTVVVVEGDLRNLVGRVTEVTSRHVRLLPVQAEVLEELGGDQIEVLPRHVRKYFKVGEHVKVDAGTFKGQTGLIVKVNTDSGIVHIMSDTNMEEIEVFDRDLVEAGTEVSGALETMGQFGLHDFVTLDERTCGVIVRVERDAARVLTNDLEVILVRPGEIQGHKSSKFVETQDMLGNVIAVGDMVQVQEGVAKDKGKEGTVMHIFRGILWLQTRSMDEQSGIIATRSRWVRVLGGQKRRNDGSDVGPSTAGGLTPGRSPFHPSQGMGGGAGFGGLPMMSPRIHAGSAPGAAPGGQAGPMGRGGGGAGRPLQRDRKVVISRGAYADYKGIIRSATETEYTLELEAITKKLITVPRSYVSEVGAAGGAGLPPRPGQPSAGMRPSIPSATPLHPGMATPAYPGMATPAYPGMATPAYPGMATPMHPGGGMTPMHGGMTPMHGGMTPMHGGGMTPMHGGGMTPGHENVWDAVAPSMTPAHDPSYAGYGVHGYGAMGRDTGGFLGAGMGGMATAPSSRVFHFKGVAAWVVSRAAYGIILSGLPSGKFIVQLARGAAGTELDAGDVLLVAPLKKDHVLVVTDDSAGTVGKLQGIDKHPETEEEECIIKDSSGEFKFVDMKHVGLFVPEGEWIDSATASGVPVDAAERKRRPPPV